MAGGNEVATSWAFQVLGAAAVSVTSAPRPGNCVDVLPGTGMMTITATAPDGETATVVLAK
jgi:hypothetical protein